MHPLRIYEHGNHRALWNAVKTIQINDGTSHAVQFDSVQLLGGDTLERGKLVGGGRRAEARDQSDSGGGED